MNKRDIVVVVSEQTGIPQRTVHACFSVILNTILDSLEQGEHVILKDFGTFHIREDKERFFVVPQTKEKLILPPKKKAKFRVTPKLKIK